MAIEIYGNGETVEVRSPRWSVDVRAPSWSVDVSSAVVSGGIPYSGSYEFTPSGEAQTIASTSRVFDRDITIKPIPSNYGLITWDGSVITVS